MVETGHTLIARLSAVEDERIGFETLFKEEKVSVGGLVIRRKE
jgi:hypothetical protein